MTLSPEERRDPVSDARAEFEVGHPARGAEAGHVVGNADAGRTLDRVIAVEGPLALAQAIELLRPLARELDRLHARGVVHGAVRSRQVVVAADDTVVLRPAECAGGASGAPARPDGASVARTDFGAEASANLAAADSSDSNYFSPQLLAGEDLRPADDIYALGVIAYELVTGALPFEWVEPGSPAMPRRPVPPSNRCPTLTPEVEGVLLAQLSAAPAARFATALELVRELERAATHTSSTGGPASAHRHPMSSFGVYPTARTVPAGPGARRLALAEMPDVAHAPREPARPRRVRRTDYPELGLAGFWVAVLIVVLCSVYLLPLYYILLGRF